MAQFTLQDLERIIRGLQRRLRILEISSDASVLKTGVAADRPASPTVSVGTTFSYYAYDSKVLSIWNVDDEAWDEVTLT